MIRKRYTEEQSIAALSEAEAGARTADLCRKHGMSDATFYNCYNWKAKYAGLTVSEIKRRKSLEDEKRRLKQIVAQQALDTGHSRSCCQKTSKAQGEENSGVIRHGGSWAEREEGLYADRCITLDLPL